MTSGDGGLFPPDLLVGQVVFTSDGRMRTRMSADLRRLNFMRVMRSHPGTTLDSPADLIGPPWPPEGMELDENGSLISPDSARAEANQ